MHFGVSASSVAGNSHRMASREDSSRGDDIGGLTITVVMAEPAHRCFRIFIAALGHEVEQGVGTDQDVETTGVSRIGVKDLSVHRASKDAEPRRLLHRKFSHAVVVVDLTL